MQNEVGVRKIWNHICGFRQKLRHRLFRQTGSNAGSVQIASRLPWFRRRAGRRVAQDYRRMAHIIEAVRIGPRDTDADWEALHVSLVIIPGLFFVQSLWSAEGIQAKERILWQIPPSGNPAPPGAHNRGW